jgi:energy-coupling factor transporter transmembrane protein EcfT
VQEEVQHFRSARRARAILKLALILIASVAMIVFHSRWVFTAAGVIVAVAMWVARRDYRLSWIVPAGFPLVGLYVSLFVASRHQAPAYFLAGWGLLFLLDGAFTLIRYTLQNPAPGTPQA